MSRRESKRGKSAYFVPTISISLVLIVVGMLVFILLNARAVSDHVKRNIGFAVIVKDNTNEVEIKRVQKILDTQPYVYTSKYITKEQAAKSFKKEMGEDFEAILGGNPLLPSIEIKLNPEYANNDSLVVIEKGLARFDIIQEVYYKLEYTPDHDNLFDCRGGAGTDFVHVDPEYDPFGGLFATVVDQNDAVGRGDTVFYMQAFRVREYVAGFFRGVDC